jgi:hypothetical protein
MKINVLHNHIIFGEFLDYLVEVLNSQGHTARIVNAFEYDDSDITLSTDSINTQDSLIRLDHSKYSGRIVHWLLEIFPPDSRRSFVSELRINQFRSIKDHFDDIFVRDPRQIEEMKKVFGITSKGYLLACPNPNLHKKIQAEKKYDVLFIGNMSPRRHYIFDKIRQAGVSLFIPTKYVWAEEKIQLINESRIILNAHYDETNVFETLRVMECLGSGGFFLTENFEWYPQDKLKANSDFAMVSYEEIPNAIKYYLEHEEERDRISTQGHTSAWNNFKWENEIQKMETVILTCPICHGTKFLPFSKNFAYKICQQCSFHRQERLPEKVYEGPEENFGQGPGTGHLMSEEDKNKNKALAEALYDMFHPKTVLDVGSKYPYFLSVLKDRCEVLGVDGIDDILKYGKELEVPVIKADFETMNLSGFKGKYDLISLIHLIEHLYDPVGTVEKILSCLSDTGLLYVRTPDPEVSGIERDLTDHHLKIHPFLFTRKSLEQLVNKYGFEIFRHDKLEAYGQSDFYIHKKRDDSEISLFMIVKNEEHNIKDCLESIRKHVDEIIIVDTGSTDKTKEVVAQYTDKIYDFKWVDDFAAARNFALTKCTKTYCLWMDADDISQNPQEIRTILEATKDDYAAYNFNIIYGNDVFCHARLFKNFCGVHFKGKVHEYPVLHWLPFKTETKLNVIHKTHKHVTENRILRNIRILRKEVEEDPHNARALFYLANALKELGQYDEALDTYQKYLSRSYWKDERFLAQKYMGQIYQWQKQHVKAIEELFKAILIDERWAEAYYYIGENYYYLGKYEMCIRWMQMAASMPVPDSTMFKEMAIYRDLPYRYIFASYETLGNFEGATEYCELALEKNPGDEWLKQRLVYFKQKNTEKKAPKSKSNMVIECYRQGALGDCLMTTAALRGLRGLYPDSFIRYVTHPTSFQILEGNKFIDELTTEGKPDADKKIYFCYPDRDSVLGDEGYPNKPLTRHIAKIFQECAGLPDNIRPFLECTLNEEEVQFGKDLVNQYGKYVTLHIQAGWSPYKEWYDDRWERVVEELFKMGYPTLQLVGPNCRVLKNTVIITSTIKKAISAIKHSVLHLGIDSFSNHATNATFTKAVILFGSTSPTGSGHEGNINIWKGLDCSPCYKEYDWAKDPNGPCPHNKKCMDLITVEEVLEAIKKQLS